MVQEGQLSPLLQEQKSKISAVFTDAKTVSFPNKCFIVKLASDIYTKYRYETANGHCDSGTGHDGKDGFDSCDIIKY